MTKFLNCIIFFLERYLFEELSTEALFQAYPGLEGGRGTSLATPRPASYCPDSQCIHSLCEETKAVNHGAAKFRLWLGCGCGYGSQNLAGSLKRVTPWVSVVQRRLQKLPGTGCWLVPGEEISKYLKAGPLFIFSRGPHSHLSLPGSLVWTLHLRHSPASVGTTLWKLLPVSKPASPPKRKEMRDVPGRFAVIWCKSSTLWGSFPFSGPQDRIASRRRTPFLRLHVKGPVQCHNWC